MDTYFWIRVKLKDEEKLYGPYRDLTHAQSLIGSIQEILSAQKNEAASEYLLRIEERAPHGRAAEGWLLINTVSRIKVTGGALRLDSDLVTIEVK